MLGVHAATTREMRSTQAVLDSAGCSNNISAVFRAGCRLARSLPCLRLLARLLYLAA